MHGHSSQAYPLVPHFESQIDLSGPERAALASLPARIVSLKAGHDIVR
jgi:hypothetical protein